MARISKERIKIKERLKQKQDQLTFPIPIYLKVARILQDMNKNERINGSITKEEVMYSIKQEGAPEGNFFVVRNH